jgi:hypothetical protein
MGDVGELREDEAKLGEEAEPEKRGLAASIAVVEMPATRSGPGAR